jgi:hypothetical protein
VVSINDSRDTRRRASDFRMMRLMIARDGRRRWRFGTITLPQDQGAAGRRIG